MFFKFKRVQAEDEMRAGCVVVMARRDGMAVRTKVVRIQIPDEWIGGT